MIPSHHVIARLKMSRGNLIFFPLITSLEKGGLGWIYISFLSVIPGTIARR
jgi:hypothetical protein